MKRRELLTLLGGAAVCWPRMVSAQQAKVLRIGVVSSINPRTVSYWVAFDKRLRELGYIEGQNLDVDFVNLGGQLNRYADETRKLVARKPHIIIAPGVELAVKSAVAATQTLPIVMIAIDYDPLALGYVASLARPGRNVTGLFSQQIELTEKRLQLLKDALPRLKAATMLWDRISADQWQAAQRLAPSLGIRLSGIELGEPPFDYDRVLGQATLGSRDPVVASMTPAIFPDRTRLAEALIRHRMASVFGLRQFVEAGGLFSYGANIDGVYRRAAEFVDRIAKGAKPVDLPIEQPTKFELIVNLKTAKAIGVELPTSLLLRADEVIE
jgi:putative tryptophan/tyrosine transport system substrate-binding protein